MAVILGIVWRSRTSASAIDGRGTTSSYVDIDLFIVLIITHLARFDEY
jgi:hypothetical protein